VYLYYSAFLIAVLDRVSQSFAEGQFNIRLLAHEALRSFNQQHQAVHEG
jgi:hypothetical protein